MINGYIPEPQNTFQTLERRTPLVSRRWKRSSRLMAFCISLFFLFAAASDAAPVLPGQDEVDWPLMPVLLSHARIAREAERLTGEAPTARAAEQQLQRVLRSRDATEQRIAAVVLAAHYRRNGRTSDAAALVADYGDLRPDNLAPDRLEAFLEHARLEASLGHPLAAFRALDYARDRVEGLGAPLVRVAYADVMELVPDHAKAIDWLNEALTVGNRWARPRSVSEGEDPVAPPGADRWPPLRTAIEQRIRALEFKLAVEEWGIDYVRYRFAQEARKAGHPLARDFTDTSTIYPGRGAGRAEIAGADFEFALALYDQLIAEASDTVFGEAAQLYRAYCLIHLGRSRDAERALQRLLSASAAGLYRGEALLTLGDIELQERWNPQAARRWYESGLSWARQAESVQRDARLYAVPSQAAQAARAPAQRQRMLPSGVIQGEAIPPGAVVNRLTADWYLDWLQAELLFRLGFLDALAGDWDAAREHWQRVAEHDPLLKRAQDNRYFNTLRRLDGASRNGYLVGLAEENARISPRVKPALWWADFQHLREEFESAGSLYRRLYDAAASRNDAPLGARAGLGIMLVIDSDSPGEAGTHARSRAREVGSEVLALFPRAPASAYVAFMLAENWDQAVDPELTRAMEDYRNVYRNYPNSRHARPARFYGILHGIRMVRLDKLDQYEREIEQFSRDYPEHPDWTYLLKERLELYREYDRLYGSQYRARRR